MKQGLRYLIKFLLILIVPPVIYLLFALIGSIIPVNSNSESKSAEMEIYLYKQDMHTDILLPVNTKIISWDSIFKPEHTLAQPKNSEFIGFGWGDLNFYRNTPQWEDLKLSVAFKALFFKIAKRTAYSLLPKVTFSDNLVKISVSEDQYIKLTEYILETVNIKKSGKIQPVQDLHYYRSDAFYLSKTSFSLFKTCNTWTNSALKTPDFRLVYGHLFRREFSTNTAIKLRQYTFYKLQYTTFTQF